MATATPLPSGRPPFNLVAGGVLVILVTFLAATAFSEEDHTFDLLSSKSVFQPASNATSAPVSSNKTYTYPKRVIVDTYCFALTGGPEALVQVLLSCRKVGLDCYRYAGPCKGAFYAEYPDLRRVPTVRKNDVRTGDLLIVPEVQAQFAYGASQRFKGAKVGIYLLQPLPGNTQQATRGYQTGRNVRLIPHTRGLVDFPAGKPHGSRAFLMEPYIRPSLVRHAKSVLQSEAALIDLKFKAKLVLVDNDSPGDKIVAIKRAAAMAGFRVIVPSGMTRGALEEQQKRATFVIDWCFVGAERMPIETSLYGAAVITSDCKLATNWEDLPIPERFRLNPILPPNQLVEAFKSIFELGKSKEQIRTLFQQFKPVRGRFLEEITPDHLAGQVKFAIGAMWTQEP